MAERRETGSGARRGTRRRTSGTRERRSGGDRRRPAGRARSRARTQRAAHARRTREDSRRAKAPGGLRGLITSRASNWSVDGPDERFYARQRHFWNFVMDHYFRMEVGGWHRLPEPPALFVGIHSGGMLPMDAWTLGFQWQRHFRGERILHGTVHDFLMALPGLGDYFRRIGAVPAAADSMSAALDAGHDVIVWPGGDVDALRPWSKRDQVVLADRKGFVRQALQAQVPIVPVATVGGADTLIVLTDGRGIAKRLRLDRLARSEVFPIAVGFPLGLAPGIIPQLPLPAKIRTEFLEPIHLDAPPQRAEDGRYVNGIYRQVERRIQDGVDRLAERRSFPIFG
jgi:1-acyl-sn-glycerol-3-phosphate acyltransferase